ncbi:hypothetical protein ACEPAH_8972 [Sanghuangporus vaninii]
MNSAGTLGNVVSPPLRRPIPDCYKDEYERWLLEESGWTEYGWDVSSEEESALERGEVPASACDDPSVLTLSSSTRAQQTLQSRDPQAEPSRVQTKTPATDAAAFATTFFDLANDISTLPSDTASTCASASSANGLFSSTSVDVPGPPSSATQTSMSMVFDPQEYVFLPGENGWSPSLGFSPPPPSGDVSVNICLPGTIPNVQSSSAPPGSVMTSIGMTGGGNTLLPYSPSVTPALSPSGSSICSSEDFDLESELASGMISHYQSRNALSAQALFQPPFDEKKSNGPTIDAQFIVRPLSEGCSSPFLFSAQYDTTPMPMWASMLVSKAESPAPVPSIAPMLTQAKELPTVCAPIFLPDTSPAKLRTKPNAKSKSAPGPSRTQRSARAAPYHCRESSPMQKKQSSRAKKPRAENSGLTEEKMFKCPECGYVQTPGPGAKRSFKRHLEIHYKTVEWRCRGVPQLDGTYCGGCDKVFSRKDALIRHIKHTDTGCVSDFEPCEGFSDFDFDLMFGDV